MAAPELPLMEQLQGELPAGHQLLLLLSLLQSQLPELEALAWARAEEEEEEESAPCRAAGQQALLPGAPSTREGPEAEAEAELLR